MNFKNFIATLILIVIFNKIHAQEKGLKYGIKAGLNISDLTVQNDLKATTFGELELSPRTSFHVGVFMEIPLSNTWTIQPELLYSLQGAKFKTQFLDINDEGVGLLSTGSGTFMYDFFLLPIVGKYKLFKKFSLEAGPQFGWLIAPTEDSITETLLTDDTRTENFKNTFIDTPNFDFSIIVGLGYQFDFGIYLQSRYYFGFSEFYIDKPEPFDPDVRNEVFQFSLGYKF